MKTIVSVYFNGAYFSHEFDMNIKEFMLKWNNQINAVGFFTHSNNVGKTIIINPSNCGMIEIDELE